MAEPSVIILPRTTFLAKIERPPCAAIDLSKWSSLFFPITGLPAPEPSLNGDAEPEEAVPDPRVYSAQSLGVSLGGSGGAPTALTGDTDMNGDMEGDYNSSSGEPDEDVDGEEGMSSGDESDEDSKSAAVF